MALKDSLVKPLVGVVGVVGVFVVPSLAISASAQNASIEVSEEEIEKTPERILGLANAYNAYLPKPITLDKESEDKEKP